MVVVVAILGVLHLVGIGVLPSAEVVQTVVEEIIHHSRNPHPRILHSKILLLRQLQQWVGRKTNLLENVKPCENEDVGMELDWIWRVVVRGLHAFELGQ